METRYYIEYVNPRHPLRDNGSINVRYDRVLTLEQAEHDLTLILSFGGKILDLYMGNVVDGETGEWSPKPMIVDDDDWFTTEWLKSIKDRVLPQPKHEWSEEDEKFLKQAIEEMNYALNDKDLFYNGTSPIVDWLKSIRNRITWKPTKEQMRALHDINLTGDISYAGQGQTLIELYNDLKKLKGE